jgi:hypothetical protein
MTARTLTLAAGLVILAAAGAALFQHHRAHNAELSARTLSRQADLLAGELRRQDQRRTEADRARAELRRRLAEAGAPAGVRPAGPAAATAPTDPAQVRQGIVRAHAAAALRYRALLQSLHLAPDQAKQLEVLLEDYESKARDVWDAGNAGGVPTADPSLWALLKPDHDQLQAAVTALAGDGVYQQVAEYNRTLAARDFTTALAANLYFSDTPLTPAQSEQLVAAIAGQSAAYQQGHSAIDLYTMDWSQAYPQLAGVLSPPQLAALQNVVAARQAYVKLAPLIGAPGAVPAR